MSLFNVYSENLFFSIIAYDETEASFIAKDYVPNNIFRIVPFNKDTDVYAKPVNVLL